MSGSSTGAGETSRNLPRRTAAAAAASVGHQHRRLPVHQVVRPLVGGIGPAVARGQVLEELDARAGGGAEAGDVQPGALHVVQVLLLGPEVHALAGHPEAEHVAVERQARLGVAHHDGGVVDAEEQPVARRVPLRIALVRRELQDLERVAVGIRK